MSLADDPLGDAERARRPANSMSWGAGLVATAAWAFDHETELRTMLRLSLAPMSNPGEA
jgi:hypothetical protein